MPTIIKIGYQEFLVKSEAQAVKAITALAGAIKVESRHVGECGRKNWREVFWPSDRDSEVSMKTVRPEQLVSVDPGDKPDVEVMPAALRQIAAEL